jgi:hypothetical protein
MDSQMGHCITIGEARMVAKIHANICLDEMLLQYTGKIQVTEMWTPTLQEHYDHLLLLKKTINSLWL